MRPYAETEDYRQLTPMQQYLVHEFIDDYEDGLMSRRDMVQRVMHITGGVATTATLLASMGVPSTSAQDATPPANSAAVSPLSIPEGDPRASTGSVMFPGNDGQTITGYEARPADGGATPGATGLPLVLVCHENRGLTDHIRDVTRRWASNGYVACAVDLLSREGGTASITDQSQIPGLLSNTDPERHVADFRAAIRFYAGGDGVDHSRIGMNGFCFGGGITWRTVCAAPEIRAAAPYYGPPPPLAQVPKIRAAVLGVYSADADDFANNGRAELEQALSDNGKTYRFAVYPGTQHAFNNDTSPRYNAEQAWAAWRDTLDWFARYLG